MSTKKIIKKVIRKKTEKKEGWMPVNRKDFPRWINTNFRDYISTGHKTSTRQASGQPGLFLHQKIVRKFLSHDSPYRGLLLYHGLGSGKTCSSIAIAESLKKHMKVAIFLPASLRPNYVAELKFCGNEQYYLGQHWRFERCSVTSKKAIGLQKTYNIPPKIFRKFRPQGCWISTRVSATHKENFKTLTSEEQAQIHTQIEGVMEHNYEFVHYNGIRKEKCKTWEDMAINPFSNKLVIIDEVHNFISRVVGGGDTGYRLYRLLLDAENTRFVLLSGTPMINYPHESGLLLNLLRGKMTTYSISLDKLSGGKWTDSEMKIVMDSLPVVDYYRIDSYNQVVLLSRTPNGFVKVNSNGEISKEDGNSFSDTDFVPYLKELLHLQGYRVGRVNTQNNLLAYPDEKESFEAMFIKGGKLDNIEMFRNRMLGMISYYQGAKDDMFPRSFMMIPKSSSASSSLLKRVTQREAYRQGNFVIPVSMSDYQFKKYEEVRKMERDLESNNSKKAIAGKSEESFSSYYRVFSRCYGNFVFPEGLDRPIPSNSKLSIEEAEEVEDFDNLDETAKLSITKQRKREIYIRQKNEILTILRTHKDRYLTGENLKKFSPKYAEIIRHLSKCPGGAFVYSQFREMEGIGIFSTALEANGYAKFNIRQNDKGEWEIVMDEKDIDKPKYCFYTGWESPEIKEITKTIFNNELDKLPESLRDQITTIKSQGNLRGDIIKIFLATSSAAEGITLCNVRQVHIMEPYWNPVRTEQVIGRAVRIGSHEHLPLQDREVEIYCYVSDMTKSQLDESFTIRNKDASLTSDQYLYQISESKRSIMQGIVQLFREASIDCTLNAKDNEPVDCVTFPKGSEKFSFSPDIYTSSTPGEKKTTKKIKRVSPKPFLTKSSEVQKTKKVSWKPKSFNFKGKKYILNETILEKTGTSLIYDYSSYQNHKEKGSDLVELGKFTKKPMQITFF